jgi:hypothetical protein
MKQKREENQKRFSSCFWFCAITRLFLNVNGGTQMTQKTQICTKFISQAKDMKGRGIPRLKERNHSGCRPGA